MSKIEDLLMRRDAAVQDYDETIAKCKAEETEINDEIEKLEKEFEQKVKRLFRGVHLTIQVNKEGLEISLGEESHKEFFLYGSDTHIFGYNSTSYGFKKQYITRATADKIKALYIEYFGEL